MDDSNSNIEKARRYLKAIEDGDAAFVVSLFSPDAFIEQLPNRIYPQGIRSSVSRIAEAFEKGRKLFSRQSYKITSEVVNENAVALEVVWSGTLSLPFGTIAAGGEMRAYSAMFMQFQDGKIVLQRNYDCFEPW
jgi:ketosteroid isomerase-like protein